MTQRDGFGMIPLGAKIAALCVVLLVIGIWVFFAPHGLTEMAVMGCIALLMALLFAGYILLAGYVYADAKRRGMPAGLWTALVILIPNAIGFVLYFLLRKPLLQPCPACGQGVEAGSAFCPKCGQSQLARAPLAVS